ncbi:MDR family MFS transporter [Nakamurella multipartita]|uniref:Drug resistance transporter, EmrB/QacA subfamily n=1 Tax=Nakamurella multipartita (strain ATCC 700099 / DSM 44233 / CIP 104796 / JCM 9543 / NBRC 105858 / Y-104) TaxID=479431 RepID=C8X9A9_NAKMY|nr:MDR family MFS transporter [Nakamurella multipartita]ACV77177.1 drug resistance transporter, EmrB/QacA subfamily [Nakamurella multipartita DSM 44233]
MATATGEIQAAPTASPSGLTHKQIRFILFGLMAGMLLAALDQTIVSTSIRVIADDLHGLSAQAWVTTAYLITSTVTTPLYGKLSDIYGRRPMFLTAISIFIFGSLLCTFSTSMYELAAFRAIQGIGAGGLFSMALAILADIAPPRERAKYQGYFLAVFGMSSVVGPLVGGFFAGAETILGIAGWRWVFLVNVPIGILALVIVSITLHIPHMRHDHRVDWWGATALMVGLVPLLIVAEQGREWGWMSGSVLGLILLGIVGIAAFIAIEIKMKDEALIPMRLFRSRVFSTGLGANVLIGLGMFGALSTLPLYLQLVKGATPTESGLLLIPMMVGIMGGSVLSGQLTMRTGRYKIFPVMGTALLTASFFLMLTVDVDTGYPLLDLYFVMIGLGLGLCMQTLLIAVQNTVPAKDMGVATSSATFFRQLGGTLGVAVFLSLLFNSLPDKIQGAFQSAAGNPAFLSAVQTAAQDPNSPGHATALALVQAQTNPAAAASVTDAFNSDSSFLSTLDANIARPFQEGYVASTQLVYIIGGIIMAVAFVLVLTMKELPLRTQSAIDERLAEQAAEAKDAEALSFEGAFSAVDAGDASTAATTRPTTESTSPSSSGGGRHQGGRHSAADEDLVPAWEIAGDTVSPGAGRHRA